MKDTRDITGGEALAHIAAVISDQPDASILAGYESEEIVVSAMSCLIRSLAHLLNSPPNHQVHLGFQEAMRLAMQRDADPLSLFLLRQAYVGYIRGSFTVELHGANQMRAAFAAMDVATTVIRIEVNRLDGDVDAVLRQHRADILRERVRTAA